MKTVTFYHSVICPRCAVAKLSTEIGRFAPGTMGKTWPSCCAASAV